MSPCHLLFLLVDQRTLCGTLLGSFGISLLTGVCCCVRTERLANQLAYPTESSKDSLASSVPHGKYVCLHPDSVIQLAKEWCEDAKNLLGQDHTQALPHTHTHAAKSVAVVGQIPNSNFTFIIFFGQIRMARPQRVLEKNLIACIYRSEGTACHN